MNALRHRWAQLKARFHRQQRGDHHRHVVHVPWGHESGDYLVSLPCRCGQVNCERQTFGLVVPEILNAERWSRQAQVYAAQRGDHA